MKITLKKTLYIRLGLVLLLNLVYYLFQWEFLVNTLGNILAWMYQNWIRLETSFKYPGFTGELAGKTFLGRSCLYIELYAFILPFLYDKKKSILKNIVYIILILSIIQIINISRIYFSVLWRISADVPRWLHHDLPDTLIWYPLCFGFGLYGMFKHEPVSVIIEKRKQKD